MLSIFHKQVLWRLQKWIFFLIGKISASRPAPGLMSKCSINTTNNTQCSNALYRLSVWLQSCWLLTLKTNVTQRQTNGKCVRKKRNGPRRSGTETTSVKRDVNVQYRPRTSMIDFWAAIDHRSLTWIGASSRFAACAQTERTAHTSSYLFFFQQIFLGFHTCSSHLSYPDSNNSTRQSGTLEGKFSCVYSATVSRQLPNFTISTVFSSSLLLFAAPHIAPSKTHSK